MANTRKTNALAGKVALITGSSRGIGLGIAKLFAAHGARVALHGRDNGALAAAHAAITSDARSETRSETRSEAPGVRSIVVTGDVTSFAEIEAMRARVESELGPIDILVANAGGSFSGPPGPVEDISEEGWRASVDGNLTSTFLCIKSVLPGMKARKSGNIITMSSSAGRRAHPRSPVPYAAAKAGIQLLTQDVAAQAGAFGVRANCIAPETILTEKNEERIPAEMQKMLIDQHPIRRLGTSEDVAHAALFLASDASAWITGVIIDVAGGATMV